MPGASGIVSARDPFQGLAIFLIYSTDREEQIAAEEKLRGHCAE